MSWRESIEDDAHSRTDLEDLELCRECGEELHTDEEYKHGVCGSCVSRRVTRAARVAPRQTKGAA